MNLTKLLAFFYPGKPRPKARHRSAPVMRDGKPVLGKGGRPIVRQYHDKAAEAEEMDFASFAKIKAGSLFITDGALLVRIVAFVQKPKSAKKSAIWPMSKPDLDNYQKMVSDALNKVVYDDDSRIVGYDPWKMYSDRPGVYIAIFRIDGPRFEPDEVQEMMCEDFCLGR